MVNGGYAYGYLFMSQNPNVENVFDTLLKNIKPDLIIEIGTFHGGLTLLLRDILDRSNLKETIIVTYDINEQEFLKPLVTDTKKIVVKTQNLFNEDYSDFKDNDAKNEIATLVNSYSKCLVLCDGGCKKCEFNLIAPLLKSNDVIMAHDYAPNQEFFDNTIKDVVWDWLEIQDSDIESVSSLHNFKSYLQDIAQQAAWLCRIKE